MRVVSAEEAVEGIESGQQIYLQCAAATPSVLLDALVARAPELSDVRRRPPPLRGARAAPGAGDGAPFPSPRPVHRAERPGGGRRGPSRLHPGLPVRRPAAVRSAGCLPLDAVFVNATPPDAHGFCSLGTSVEAMHAAIRAARQVIVQFNRAMPRTLGDSFIHVAQIDLAVECDVPPYEHTAPPIGEVERRIGEYVAELVPDGSTLQLGIGAIPAATAWPCATSAISGSTPRCSPTRSSTWSRPA